MRNVLPMLVFTLLLNGGFYQIMFLWVPQAFVGHLTSIAFPFLGNLTKNLGPRVGTFVFFLRGGMGPSHIVSCARLQIPVLSGTILPVWR